MRNRFWLILHLPFAFHFSILSTKMEKDVWVSLLFLHLSSRIKADFFIIPPAPNYTGSDGHYNCAHFLSEHVNTCALTFHLELSAPKSRYASTMSKLTSKSAGVPWTIKKINPELSGWTCCPSAEDNLQFVFFFLLNYHTLPFDLVVFFFFLK